MQLQGFRWLVGLDWNPVTNRISLLSIDDGGTYIVWSVAPDGTDVRRLYSDSQPIGAMCSSPATGVLYLFRTRSGAHELVDCPVGGQDQGPTVIAGGLQVSLNRCSVSTDGERLLYTRKSGHRNLWRLDLQGSAPTATALTRGTSALLSPNVSPDGQWIVATQGHEPDFRIVKIPIGGGEPVAFAKGFGAAWSPDGRRLAFMSALTGTPRIWISDADGLGPREVKDVGLLNSFFPLTWLSDGRLLWRTPDGTNYVIRDLESGREEFLLKKPELGWVFDEPHFSPRGDQVAVYPGGTGPK